MKWHQNHIDRNNKKFYKYLRSKVLGKNYSSYIDDIAKKTEVYIFSGIIRDFFIKGVGTEKRDLDLVVIDFPAGFLDNFKSDVNFISASLNKFGGIKLVMEDLIIDIWRLRDTWGIKKMKLDTKDALSLIKTTFFNFSSIVFDYNEKKFLHDKKFDEFLENRTMDVVFSRNLDDTCCIVSTLHYKKEFDFGVSDRLARWLRDKYNPKMDFDGVQIRRFGLVEFSSEEIREFIF